MTYPTIISFYTDDWKYPEYADLLKADCERLGLEHHIKLRENTGKWINNTRAKPSFILEALKELKGPVLWIDVDGSIYEKPELMLEYTKYDMAPRPANYKWGRKWHVSTMYFNYTEKTIAFLEEWVARCEAAENISDELCLEYCWANEESIMHTMDIGELPVEYFDEYQDLDNEPKDGTVVCVRFSLGDSKHKFLADRRQGKFPKE